jgi:hypothetical protein
MAKARDIAALAGLAGLAYAMRNKGDASTTDTGDETDRLKARKPAGEESRRQITDYMKKAPEAEDANYGNEGRRTSMGVAPAPKTTTKAAPELKTITTRKDPREAEAGMTRGRPAVVNKNPNGSIEAPAASNRTDAMRNASRAAAAAAKRTTSSATDARSAETGMSRGTRTTSTAGAGRGFVNPPVPKPADPRSAEAGMSRGTRTTSTAGAGRGSVNPPMPTPKDPREAEAGMSRGSRITTPPFKGGQKGYDEAGNFMGGQRGFDEAGNPMKKGGAVKMASGGMTASRRGDGIASRGKTRGKLC